MLSSIVVMNINVVGDRDDIGHVRVSSMNRPSQWRRHVRIMSLHSEPNHFHLQITCTNILHKVTLS